MTAEDLQCKDWILNNLSKTYEQVGDINLFEDKIYAGKEENEWYHWELDSGEFGSIPLTPEILEKNGFTNLDFYAELIMDGVVIQCDCYNVRIKTKDRDLIDIPCDSVHELQHALRLCKIKKEIKL